MLQLRGALQESWMEDVVWVRRCVVAVQVAFADLCGVVAELITIWESVRDYVLYTGPPHIMTESDRKDHSFSQVVMDVFVLNMNFLISFWVAVIVICVLRSVPRWNPRVDFIANAWYGLACVL